MGLTYRILLVQGGQLFLQLPNVGLGTNQVVLDLNVLCFQVLQVVGPFDLQLDSLGLGPFGAGLSR